MQTKKKSFQIYFDNVPLLMALPDDQLGRMMKQLFCYAAEVAEQPEVTPEAARMEVEEDDKLSGGAKMAFHFMSASVYRDTQRWWQTTRARLAREEARRIEKAGESFPLSSPGEISYPRRF